MSAIGVLVGLLFAAYAGSMLMSGRRLRVGGDSSHHVEGADATKVEDRFAWCR